jgi:ubiquinone biosynthesis accessory factor UbiJ
MRLPFEPMLIGALNHLLSAQSWARDRLVPHAGDVVRLELGATVVELAIDDAGLFVAAPATAPEVTIAVPLSAVPRLLARDPQARRSVTVTGNVGLAGDLEYLFANLRWDAEADLSRVVGDIAAHRIARAGATAAQVPGQIAASVARSTRQFLTEEQPVLARADEVAGFVAEIDHLRDDVERLAKRVERLQPARRG